MIMSSRWHCPHPSLKTAVIRPIGWLALLCAGLLMSGCANRPASLYAWDGYQPQLYDYFRAKTGPEEQVIVLEADLQKIQAKGATPPPGFHAHLGLLYASLGKDEQAVQAFQTEKSLFPESARYMDFLLAKAKK